MFSGFNSTKQFLLIQISCWSPVPDVTYCPPHALLQLMNAEMCSKELHPCVHAAAAAVWAISTCNYAAFCAMGAHREQEQGPHLSLGTLPVTGDPACHRHAACEKKARGGKPGLLAREGRLLCISACASATTGFFLPAVSILFCHFVAFAEARNF